MAVQFFEVVLYRTNGDEERFDPWQWTEWLQDLHAVAREDRLVVTPRRRLLGIPFVVGSRQHLLLGELLEQADLPWEEHDEEGVAQRAAEGDQMRLSILAYTGIGNVFALARLQSYAPGYDAFERFLNGLKLQVPGQDKGALLVRAVQTKSEITALNEASGARSVTVTLGGSPADVPENSPARAWKAWKGNLSNFRVTMTIELERVSPTLRSVSSSVGA